MNPRKLIEFFKTRSGRLATFTVGFLGLLSLGSLVYRHNRLSSMEPVSASSRTNRSDRPQVVQTIRREMDPLKIPAPKPEPRPIPSPATNPHPVTPVAVAAALLPASPPPPLPPISLFHQPESTVPAAKTLGPVYAPFGRLISCETIVTVDSASIQTPIIGLITEDVYHRGQLVIPAGTEVHGQALADRSRERIASGTSWTLVWQTGEELRIKAMALDREFDTDQEGWGITDGSAGLRGQRIQSDNLDDIKLFAATFLSGAAAALTEKESTLFGSIDRPSLNNAPIKGAQAVLDTYAQRILTSIQRDGFFVRIASGKQFYLYTLQTLDRAEAVIGGRGSAGSDTPSTATPEPEAAQARSSLEFPVTPTPLPHP